MGISDVHTDMNPEGAGESRGVELLVLPHSIAPEHSKVLTQQLPEVTDVTLPNGSSDADRRDGLFWFRWVIGHQTTFILWRLLAVQIASARTALVEPANAIKGAGQFVRAYSGMLLYTGSVSRVEYHRSIRPRMVREHPAISGGWASDYRPVRRILRARDQLVDLGGLDSFAGECALSERIHQGIADKLVPSGVSLLQAASIAGKASPLTLAARSAIYDRCFSTVRAEVSYEEIIGQLKRRVRTIQYDLADNGWCPADCSDSSEVPAVLEHRDIVAVKDALPELLDETVRTAVELTHATKCLRIPRDQILGDADV